MEYIGKSVPRTDGADKVTGEARYVDDLSFPGMFHGVTVRTETARGKLLGIQWDPGVDWSKTCRVDHTDIPGENTIYLMEKDQPALVFDEFMHAEEPVALIAAETREEALSLRSRVTLKTSAERPVFDLRESLRAESPIYSQDNVFKRIQMEKGQPLEAMERADQVYVAEYRVGYQEQMYIEPQGVIAVPNGEKGITIYGSLQCPFYVVKALSPLLKMAPEKIRVIQCVTGGGFGGKEEYPSMISAHAALLALKSNRPVKIIYDRAEDIRATTKRHPAIITHRTGFSSAGELLAMDIEVLMDGGAYMTLSPVVLSRAAIHAAGPYRCDHIRVMANVVATNTPPNGAFRGFGAPQAAFAIERQIDAISRQAGLTPLEIRQKNMLCVGDTTATGQVLLNSVGAQEALDMTISKSGYKKKWAACKLGVGSNNKRTGVGLSLFLHGGGFTGNGEVYLNGKVDMSLDKSGVFTIWTASTDIGQGTLTIFPQIAADALGVPMSLIKVAEQDTANVPDSGPTVASRTCMVVGKIVEDAANALGERIRLEKASELGLSPEDVVREAGRLVWPGGTCSMVEFGKKMTQKRGEIRVRASYQNRDQLEWDDETYSGGAYPCYAWAAVVVEVEVDMDTYVPRVVSFTTAQDIGKAINPVLAAGQIEGGSLQGIGWASMEEVRMKDGRYLNHRMTDCIIPTSLDAPEMEVFLVEHPYEHGPNGAKGLGELPMDLPAPAIAAAIEQATGVEVDSAPFTPEMLCARLVNGEAGT